MSKDTTATQIIINKMTKEQYEALAVKSPSELYFITNEPSLLDGKITLVNAAGQTKEFDGTEDLDLSAGIAYAKEASDFATGGTIDTALQGKEVKLTSANAGTGISITRDTETDVVTISNTNSAATWGNITGTLSNQTDLQEALNGKQDELSETQLAAVNSGITQTKVTAYDGYATSIANNTGAIEDINEVLEGYGDIVTHDADEFATAAQGAKADTAVQPGDIADMETKTHAGETYATKTALSTHEGDTVKHITAIERSSWTAKQDPATTLAGYGIGDAYTKTEIDGKIAGVFHVKPSVTTVADLPLTDNTQGDCRNVTATGDNYVWTSTEATGTAADWDKLSGVVDLSAYRTAADQDVIDATKQDKLTAGDGIDLTSNTVSLDVSSYTSTDAISLTGASVALADASASISIANGNIALTGTSVTAPTVAEGDDSTKVATTAFVANAVENRVVGVIKDWTVSE